MILDVDGLEIYCEVSGSQGDPALLLVAGHGAQVTDWDPELIDAFVGAGLRVVRYDNRDSGQSSFADQPADLMAILGGDVSSVTYGLDDLAADGLGVLDALGIEAAHVVGHSMGAMVAQLMAIRAPRRVLSLASIAGTTGAPGVGQPAAGIPELLLGRSQPDLTPEQRIEASVKASSAWSSFDHGVTEDYLRERAERRQARSRGTGGGNRHLAAVMTAADRTEQLSELTMPVLVVHGADDPLVDVSGGRATAAAVPNAELLIFKGVKHDLPPAIRPSLIEAVLANVARAH